MRSEDETLLKVLQNVKDKYYSKSETYFDEVLKQLKKAEISQMENGKLKMENELVELKAENEKLKYYLKKIREDELNSMDVEFDEYITECTSTEYSNIINFVELALGERDE